MDKGVRFVTGMGGELGGECGGSGDETEPGGLCTGDGGSRGTSGAGEL